MPEELLTQTESQSNPEAESVANPDAAAPQGAPEVPTEELSGNDTPESQADDKELSKVRKEAASYRVKLREQEQATQALEEKLNTILDGLSQLSGKAPEPEVTPEDQLKAALAQVEEQKAAAEAAEQRARKIETERKLEGIITAKSADPFLTLAVLNEKNALQGLDPTADDWSSQVEQLVDETVAAHPQLRTQVVSRSSGNAPTPTNNGDGTLTERDLIRMQQAGEYEAINKAFAAGRFKLNR